MDKDRNFMPANKYFFSGKTLSRNQVLLIVGIIVVAIIFFWYWFFSGSKTQLVSLAQSNPDGRVLAATTTAANSTNPVLKINIPAEIKNLATLTELVVQNKSVFEGQTEFMDDLILNGNLKVDEIVTAGSIKASNVVYTVKAGAGISVSGTQDVTISASDLGSGQNIFKNIEVNSDTIAASSNNDKITFKNGTGITLSSSGKEITIATSNTSGWSRSGTYVTVSAITDSVGIGTLTPTAKLEINSGTADTAGLKFTRITSSTTPAATGTGGGKVLAVDSGGNVVLVTDQTGTSSAEAILPTSDTGGTIYYNGSNWAASTNLYHDGGKVGISTNSPDGRLQVNTNDAAEQGIIVKGYTSQSANLIELKNSDGNNVSYFDSNGAFHGDIVGDITGDITGAVNPGLTLGSVVFQGSSGLADDNSNFFWDDGTNRLGLGTNSPGATLDVRGTVVFNEAAGDYDVRMEGQSSANLFFLDASTNRIGLGTNAPSTALHILNTSTQLRLGYDTSNYADMAVDSAGALTLSANGVTALGISSSKITSYLPHEFLAAGDVAMAYDLNFTNPTASYVNSQSPLYFQAGEVFNSSDLTLRTFNAGNVIIDSQALVANYAATVSGQLVVGTSVPPANISNFYLTNSTTTGKALAILNQTESADIFTASASGVPKFVINSAGNVGIGTTSPSARLDIKGDSSNPGGDLAVFRNGGTVAALTVRNSNGSTSNFGGDYSNGLVQIMGSGTYGFNQSSGTAIALNIAPYIVQSSTAGYTGLNIKATESSLGSGSNYLINALAGATGSTQEFFVTNSGGGYFAGNVGIGTTSPVSLLDVSGAAGSGTGRNGAITSFQGLSIYNTTANGRSFIEFGSSQSSTSSTVGGLVVFNSAIGAADKRIGQVSFSTDGAINSGALDFITWNAGTAVNAIRIAKDGNVGIGNTSPAMRFQAGSSTRFLGYDVNNNRSIFRMDNNGAGTAAALQNLDTNSVAQSSGLVWQFARTGDATARDGGQIIVSKDQEWTSTATTNDSSMSFYTTHDGSSYERIRISAAGYVGIGSSNAEANLHVSGNNSYASIIGQRASSDNAGFDWDARKSRGTLSSRTAVQSGDVIGNFVFRGYDGSAWQWAAGIAASVDGTPGSSDMPGRLSFYTTPDGSATAAEVMRIDNQGNVGIGTTSFGTGAAKVLALAGSTAPSTAITDGIQLFAVDQSGSHELRVMDEAANITTLSPHNFSLLSEGRSEEMAWSYYSERGGLAINADMTRALRLVEQLSGEKLITIKDLTTKQEVTPELNQDLPTAQTLLAEGEIPNIAKWNYQLWTFMGEVIFEKPVKFMGEVAFSAKVKFNQSVEYLAEVVFQKPVKFADKIELNRDSIGRARIKAGDNEVRVAFDQAYQTEPIVTLTLASDVKLDKYLVEAVDKQGFTIKMDPKLTQDVLFTWHAFGGSDVKEATSAGQLASPSPSASPIVESSPTPEPTVSPTPASQTSSAGPAGPTPSPAVLPEATESGSVAP